MIDVDLDLTVHSDRRAFRLQLRFSSTARRCALFGPSGAGKSLTLQAVAGLVRPDRGRIVLAGDVLFDSAAGIDVPARARRVGYLFQDHALFPRLDVRQNIAFGLRRGPVNPSRDAADAAVEHWLRAFELTAVAAQRPHQLSGGQRQRTALARALAPSPRALLLDEPFSALDPPLRERMRAELDAVLAGVDVPVLMITHDPVDLERFGDARFFIEDGQIREPPAGTANR